jgi:pyruvate kinase
MTKSKTNSTVERKTKIVATLGPASREYEMIKKLIIEGVNVFRLNFSHGSHEEHLESLLRIRKASNELGEWVGVLQDLSGPKIRITDISEGFTEIGDNEEIILKASTQKELTTNKIIYAEGPNPNDILKAGDGILLSDGIITLQVEALSKEGVHCRIIKGGRLRARAGIAYPDSHFHLPATTEKDLVDFAWGIENEVDFVAISFVNNAEDIRRLKAKLSNKLVDPLIIAKIERKVALDNIEEILAEADGVMVARGDLGLELPLEQIPHIQRNLIKKANERGIPVIVATQMLHSMINSVRPSRAEASDIAVAVTTGTDAVMLSEETAIGKYPIEAVGYLGRVAFEAEKQTIGENSAKRELDPDSLRVTDAVAYAACSAAQKLKAKAIIACSESGKSARLVSKYRPETNIFVASCNDSTLRRAALNWGVKPLLVQKTEERVDEIDSALNSLSSLSYLNLQTGDKIVITNGLATNRPGSTSVLEVKIID